MTDNKSKADSVLTQDWVPIAAAAFGALTLIFLMSLVVAAALGHEIPPGSRFLVVSVIAFGLALSVSFIGGNAAARGKLPFPFAKKHPLEFTVTGGLAAFVVVMFLGFHFYVHQRPPPPPDLIKGHVIVFDGFKEFDQSGYRFASQSIVPWNAGSADLLVAKPDGTAKPYFFLPYQSEDFKNPDWDKDAQAGILEVSAVKLTDVKECPSDGYKHHWYQPRQSGIYCLRSRDGKHFAVIRVDSIDDDRIGFDFVYQPSASPKF